MPLPSRIAESPNVAWLRTLTALTPEELRQRENHSEVGSVEEKPLDVAKSDGFAREIWSVLNECAAK